MHYSLNLVPDSEMYANSIIDLRRKFTNFLRYIGGILGGQGLTDFYHFTPLNPIHAGGWSIWGQFAPPPVFFLHNSKSINLTLLKFFDFS